MKSFRDGKRVTLPHPIEWIVEAATMVSSKDNTLVYEKLAQFRHESHAKGFAKSIKCYSTAIIPPAINGVVR